MRRHHQRHTSYPRHTPLLNILNYVTSSTRASVFTPSFQNPGIMQSLCFHRHWPHRHVYFGQYIFFAVNSFVIRMSVEHSYPCSSSVHQRLSTQLHPTKDTASELYCLPQGKSIDIYCLWIFAFLDDCLRYLFRLSRKRNRWVLEEECAHVTSSSVQEQSHYTQGRKYEAIFSGRRHCVPFLSLE